MLQVVQSDHQPCRLGWTADWSEEFAEALIERRPRYQRRQTDQAVAHVDDGIETLAEKIGVGTTTADRLHGKTPEIRAAGTSSRYYLTSVPAKESHRFNKLENSSGRTIDGDRLCDLLKQYALGVKTEMLENITIFSDSFKGI